MTSESDNFKPSRRDVVPTLFGLAAMAGFTRETQAQTKKLPKTEESQALEKDLNALATKFVRELSKRMPRNRTITVDKFPEGLFDEIDKLGRDFIDGVALISNRETEPTTGFNIGACFMAYEAAIRERVDSRGVELIARNIRFMSIVADSELRRDEERGVRKSDQPREA